MELGQLKLGDKVKLQLIQPQIKCSGRDDVTAYYRGKVKGGSDTHLTIEFKYKGKVTFARYNLVHECFTEKEYQDIKIVG